MNPDFFDMLAQFLNARKGKGNSNLSTEEIIQRIIPAMLAAQQKEKVQEELGGD